jgi:hypothetical protein
MPARLTALITWLPWFSYRRAAERRLVSLHAHRDWPAPGQMKDRVRRPQPRPFEPQPDKHH